MPKIIATRKIKSNFNISAYLTSKGYRAHNHFALHDSNINGWEVWTLHVPNPALGKYDNYAIGLRGDKFVVIDPEGVVFNNTWISELLK